MVFLLSCTLQDNEVEGDKILSESFGKKLYLSELNEILSPEMSSIDSQYVISKYTEDWLMDNILYNEAKKTVGNNIDINNLVEDYRRSLFINEWQKKIIGESIDTTVTQAQIDTFFAHNKEQFILPESIVRFILVKIPEEADNETFKTYWKNEDMVAIQHFINLNDGESFLNVFKWHYKSFLKNLIPEKLFNKINFNKLESYSQTDNNSKYYVKVLEYVKDQSEAPVTFASDRIRHRIQQQRIKSGLNKKKSDLYDKNIKNKSIKIY